MKTLKIIFFIALALILSEQQTSAQDVFGRGKNIDTVYLNPNDFNINEVIKVDTVNGSKVFVGEGSLFDQPKKFIAALMDTTTSTNVSNKLHIDVLLP